MEIGRLSLLGTWLATWAVAVSSGAVVVWVLGLFRELWNRPRLQIQIDLERGPVVETRTIDQQQYHCYARLIVQNQGRSLAKNCCAYIDYIRRIKPTDYVFRGDLIDLTWSLLRDAPTMLHVSSRGYRVLNIGHTAISATDLAANRHDGSIFWIDGAIIPERLI